MYKTAIGQDSHRFEQEPSTKPLVLGGVEIPGCPGLLGNSDADVILHALTNAISGISGVTILGSFTDALCRDRGITDSRCYLREALATLRGYRLNHVSLSVEGKRPRLEAHIPAIKESLSALLSIPPSAIGLTATTGEDLTEFGRGNGLAAIACVTAHAIRSGRVS